MSEDRSFMLPLDGLEEFRGDLIQKDSRQYRQAISRWANNAEREASLVAFPKDSTDVSRIIKFAMAHGIPIAVKGGGHSASGASSITDGVVIDLSRYLDHVRIDSDKKLGSVGGGAVWRTVDEEAIKHGLATVGGTVNHTGVGGLTLGGGYGWLSGRYGLAADNLRRATIVVADGRVLEVDASNYPDLFWAIRGGGGNFGVVTEFVFQLYPQPQTVFAGPLLLAPPALEGVVRAIDAWLAKPRDDSAICQVLAVNPKDGRPAIVLLLFYNGSEAEGREHFREFYALEPIIADMAREMPFKELNAMQNDMAGYGRGAYLKGTTQKKLDLGSMGKILSMLEEFAGRGFIPAVIYEYFPLDKINSVPTDATAFRRELDSNVLITIGWEGKTDRSNEAKAFAASVAGIVDEGQSRRGSSTLEKAGYTNYASETDTADRARTAFSSNYPRLQKIKAEYDPGNMFNRWFPITPASHL